ncbi:pheromone-regulated protein prm10 [Linderina macrospora]|uniref:Pheromone-regulated protein prm10 n=1 Tax=Linderina macrospora TaxID=4868 RepID=A0ACC1JI18_9FUNG|nr:pheromone-regulated protein prm10 [Linderina macrospora]
MDKDSSDTSDSRSGYSHPSDTPDHPSPATTQQSDQSAPAVLDPHTISDSDEDSFGAIFVSSHRTQLPPVGGPSHPISAPSDGSGGDKPNRPILRLAMLNAQEKANVRNHDSFTAPVRSEPIELPPTGYFAPRGALQRASTSVVENPKDNGRNKKAHHGPLRFASRDSVHTIESGEFSHLHNPIDAPRPQSRDSARSGNAEPPGLRRRLTRAGTSMRRWGQALNAVTGRNRALYTSDSDSDTDTENDDIASNNEVHMEQLLDKKTNNEASNPLRSNTAANNAEIAATSVFYPVNPAANNPGVIHVNMSGHETARNIIESVLGVMGTSTAQYRRDHPEVLEKSSPVGTPAELEAGYGKGGKRLDSAPSTPPSSQTNLKQDGGYFGQPLRQTSATPGSMFSSGMPPTPLGATPTSLRGVYANLNKLQSRMAEHQQRRDLRMRAAKAKEAKARAKLREKEEKERRERARTQGKTTPFGTVGNKIRKIPVILKSHVPGTPGGTSTSPETSMSPSDIPAVGRGDAGKSFELRGFHSVPRSESSPYLSSMLETIPSRSGTPGPSTLGTVPVKPARSAGQSPIASPNTSPVVTPGWDEILASSGMLTNGSIGGGVPGSRISMAGSSDTTLVAFEAEKQKILAQLADIFDRQNFLLVASRAMMAFGAPLHRLEANLVTIALHLDVEASVAVLPGVILISFGDKDTRSSETHIVRMASGYDMHRLERTNRCVRRVLKNRISVGKGVKNIEKILATPPLYPWWVMLLDFMISSFFICPLFWKGQWVDAAASAMMGLIVGLLQLLAGRFSNYANLFEVSSAFIVGFIASLMQDKICFGTVSFAGICQLLPGLGLTLSIIEMASKNMISGTVRFVYNMCQCFLLGYGISVGSTLGTRVRGLQNNPIDSVVASMNGLGNCGEGLNKYWWFLFLPMLAITFNISISAHWRQQPAMVMAGAVGYTASYFAGYSKALTDITPAIGAFAMGLFSNVLASFSNHRSAIEPILGGVQLLVPGSLGLRTVLAFISSSGSSSGTFLYNVFSTSLSIAVGLFLSGMVVFPNRKKRVGLMTF